MESHPGLWPSAAASNTESAKCMADAIGNNSILSRACYSSDTVDDASSLLVGLLMGLVMS